MLTLTMMNDNDTASEFKATSISCNLNHTVLSTVYRQLSPTPVVVILAASDPTYTAVHC